MEALYALATGMAEVDSGWWKDFGMELLGQFDVISDFVFFATIVHNKKVNDAERWSVLAFACVGAIFQFHTYHLRLF